MIESAFVRQQQSPGLMVAGAVLQHLVGAKIQTALQDKKIEHQGFSVADAPTGRKGDFLIEDTVIHVTTAPSESLISKCIENLEQNLRPVIITTQTGAGGAVALAKDANVAHRIDVIEIEQFIATNIYEWSTFKESKRLFSVRDLVDNYNRIVSECESDPSLKIVIG